MRTRPLVPGFLKRLDHRLLITKPDVWSTRTHLVIWYCLLFTAVLAFASFVVPDDPRTDSPAAYWIGLISVVSLLALVVWLIYLLRFNVFKRYGRLSPLSRLYIFLLYFVCTGSIFAFPTVMPLVESYRANKAYSSAELVKDVNAINTKICQLEYDSLEHNLKQDTLLVVSNMPQYRSMPDETSDTAYVSVTRPNYKMTDTASLESELQSADSSQKINDSMYMLYNAYNYSFASISGYYYSESTLREESDFDLYKNVIRSFKGIDRKTVREELYNLLNKYRVKQHQSLSYEYANDESNFSRIMKTYDVIGVNRSLANIAERKSRWNEDNTANVIRFWYYATLLTTLLIFIYRHSAKTTYFLTWLVAFILFILTSIFVFYIAEVRNAAYMYYAVAGYIVLFFLISLVTFRSRIRNEVTGICINLFVFGITFLPVILVIIYYTRKILGSFENRNADASAQNTDQNIEYISYEAMHRHTIYAEFAGFFLLLILLATYIPKVYRKWYALPEE